MKETNACTYAQQWKRLPWLLLIPLGLLLPRLAACYPEAAEAYARYIYPWISRLLGAISGIFPFSLAEFLLYGLIIGVCGWLLWGVFSTILKKRPLVKLLRTVLTVGIPGRGPAPCFLPGMGVQLRKADPVSATGSTGAGTACGRAGGTLPGIGHRGRLASGTGTGG